MPTLLNPRQECYVRARAKGVGRLEAYGEAGYEPHYSSAGRLERQPEVAARLAELRARDPDAAEPAAVVARLLRLADSCEALGGAAALKEARLAVLEAQRLQAQLSEQEREDAYDPLPPELTQEQWVLRYGSPEAKQSLLASGPECLGDRWTAGDGCAANSGDTILISG